MIIEQLQNWKGTVEINGVIYNSINDTSNIDLKQINDSITIKLHTTNKNVSERKIDSINSDSETVYRIFVKQYMTKKSTPTFDFMLRWNNDKPMPLRTMIGTVVKETKGMVYMKLHGDITTKQTTRCMMCGKPITNPVSQYFGMGPQCGGHNYVNPFESEEELMAAVEKYRTEYLQKITWEGWVIKSAIEEKEILAK